MERRFDMSDFEQSLKDHADQFKMVPSKRVWNGIYNNLHPGSKWPSITVALLFLFTLITIGRFNDSPDHSKKTEKDDFSNPKNIVSAQIKTQREQVMKAPENSEIDISKAESNNSSTQKNGIYLQKKTSINRPSGSFLASTFSSKKRKVQQSIEENQPSKKISLYNLKVAAITKTDYENNFITTDLPGSSQLGNQIQEIYNFTPYENQENPLHIAYIRQGELFTEDLSIPDADQKISFSSKNPFLISSIASKDELNLTNENIFNQQNSLKSHKKGKKKKNKTEWTFYVNPLISTVSQKRIQPSANNSSMVVLSNQAPFKLLRNPRLGIETGVEMSFKIDKKFKFVTGLNLDYSGYTNLSNLVHPTYAALTLNDGNGGTYSKNYITHYGNGQSRGHVSLINYNIEASIPIGVQLKIWGNEKIKIDFATLLEPTFLLKNNAYIISSDGRYYVNDPNLVRRTNLDGHFGSYITFKSKKINWHIGPDFRYQLFSTYKNIYPGKEHLIDYGIRIGISR